MRWGIHLVRSPKSFGHHLSSAGTDGASAKEEELAQFLRLFEPETVTISTKMRVKDW